MPRRGNNIYKRKDGRWEGRIRKHNILPGESHYKYVYGKTYREVKEKMEIVRQSLQENKCSCNMTLAEAANLWLAEKRDCWKITTYSAYENLTRKYIIPSLGTCKVSKITEELLTKLVNKIRYTQNGKRLSDGYLHNICSVVIMIMNHLRTKHYFVINIPGNPIMQSRQSFMILPSDHDLAKLEEYLFTHMSKDGTSLGILTSLYTGIRIGELCGLTWENINLNDEVIYIRQNMQRTKLFDGQKNKTQIVFQKPKTVNSIREIPIPPILLPLFQKQQGEKSEFLIKGRKRAYAEPRTVEYRFEHILEKCSINKFHFHMLRHTFASRCIVKGFDVKSLSELLGHSNIQTTLNLYVHSSKQHKKQLMNLFQFPKEKEKVSSF